MRVHSWKSCMKIICLTKLPRYRGCYPDVWQSYLTLNFSYGNSHYTIVSMETVAMSAVSLRSGSHWQQIFNMPTWIYRVNLAAISSCFIKLFDIKRFFIKLLPWKQASHPQFHSDCFDIRQGQSLVAQTCVCKMWAKSDKDWQFWKIDLDLKNIDLQRLERSLIQG